jgi:hypothetical protein
LPQTVQAECGLTGVNSNQSYSLADLPKDLAGAIVIVGPTAAGIANPLPTAIGAVWPHDVQAAQLALCLIMSTYSVPIGQMVLRS